MQHGHLQQGHLQQGHLQQGHLQQGHLQQGHFTSIFVPGILHGNNPDELNIIRLWNHFSVCKIRLSRRKLLAESVRDDNEFNFI